MENHNFCRQKRAASLTGYGMIVGLVAIAAMLAVQGVGDQVTALFGGVADKMSEVGAGVGGGSGEGEEEAFPPIVLTTLDSMISQERLFGFPTLALIGDFPFFDPDGGSLESVLIENTSSGFMVFDPNTFNEITVGTEIPVTDIQNNEVAFNGTPGQVITFRVRVSGELAANTGEIRFSGSPSFTGSNRQWFIVDAGLPLTTELDGTFSEPNDLGITFGLQCLENCPDVSFFSVLGTNADTTAELTFPGGTVGEIYGVTVTASGPDGGTVEVDVKVAVRGMCPAGPATSYTESDFGCNPGDGSLFGGFADINGNGTNDTPIYTTLQNSASNALWSNASSVDALPNCVSNNIFCYDGKGNTDALLENPGGQGFPAAELCGNLTDNGRTDWYLPSLAELDVLYVSLVAGSSANDPDNPHSSYGIAEHVDSAPATIREGLAAGTFGAFTSTGAEGGCYMSSSEWNNDKFHRFCMERGRLSTFFKFVQSNVRCIRRD